MDISKTSKNIVIGTQEGELSVLNTEGFAEQEMDANE